MSSSRSSIKRTGLLTFDAATATTLNRKEKLKLLNIIYIRNYKKRTRNTSICPLKCDLTNEIGILRDSFPPNPPPILFTLQTILFIGTPNAWAIHSCVSVGFCVETKIKLHLCRLKEI